MNSSKIKDRVDMGLITSFFRFNDDGGRNDDPDPLTGLTSKDKFLIKSSWETVMKDATGSGVAVFLKLFEIQPKYHQMFPFKKIPIDELPQNKKFKAHCITVIYSFSSLVGVMETPEVLEMTAKKIGENHLDRGVDEQALQDVKQALIGAFSFMTENQLSAWDKFLDVIFDYMNEPAKERSNKN